MADIKAKSFNFGGSDRYIIPQDFIINVTEVSEGNYTADKTYAEILEAYNMGHTLYVETDIADTIRLPLLRFTNDMFLFQFLTTQFGFSVGIHESGVYAVLVGLEPVPEASESDAGKVLMVGDDGSAVWTAITNAEGVAY